MFSLVEDWRASGLTQKVFSSLHGINIGTFSYWVARSKEAGSVSGSFVELSHTPSSSRSQIEVIYPSGVRVKTERDLSLIAQLIRL